MTFFFGLKAKRTVRLIGSIEYLFILGEATISFGTTSCSRISGKSISPTTADKGLPWLTPASSSLSISLSTCLSTKHNSNKLSFYSTAAYKSAISTCCHSYYSLWGSQIVSCLWIETTFKGHFFSENSGVTNRLNAKTQLSLILHEILDFLKLEIIYLTIYIDFHLETKIEGINP